MQSGGKQAARSQVEFFDRLLAPIIATNPGLSNNRMKVASFLAMMTSLIAHGRNKGRQHKNGCHCEEERRGNLPYFFLRLTNYTRFILDFSARILYY